MESSKNKKQSRSSARETAFDQSDQSDMIIAAARVEIVYMYLLFAVHRCGPGDFMVYGHDKGKLDHEYQSRWNANINYMISMVNYMISMVT